MHFWRSLRITALSTASCKYSQIIKSLADGNIEALILKINFDQQLLDLAGSLGNQV